MRASPPPKSPLLITALQLGLLVLAIYYTFIGGQTAQGIYDHRWRLITLWFTVILIGLWLIWRWLSRYKIPRTPLDFPLLLLLVAWLLATAFSVNRTFSLEALVFFIIYLFFYYIAVDLGRWPWFVELTFNAVIGVSGLVWTLALWQLSRWYQDLPAVPTLLQPISDSLQTLPRLSVLGNPNTMASFLALVLPIVLYKFSSSRRLVSRLLLGLWLVMLTAAILLTQSRGGILALTAAVGFFALVWVGHKTGVTLGSLRVDPKIRVGVWLLGGALVLLFGLFGWLIFSRRSLTEGVDIRQQVMAGAFKSLSRHPLFGAGPGALGEEFIRYQRPLSVIWGDAHNLPLTLTAETGLIGGIGLVWLAVVGLKLLWSTLRQTDRTQWRLSSLACVAALLGFAIHNLVDSLFKFPLIMLLVAVWAGFWISSYLPAPCDTKTGPSWGRWMMVTAVIVLAGTIAIGVRGIENIKAYNQAVEAAVRRDWATAYDQLVTAAQLAPGVPFYHRQLGLVAGYLAEEDPVYRQEAIAQYQSALTGLDQLAIDHANLGCLLWVDGRQAEAVQELELAVELQPGNPLYRLNLGNYLEQRGDLEAARAEYAGVLATWPDAVQSSYWQQIEGRTAALPDIIDNAVHMLVETGSFSNLIELYLFAGNYDAARQAYEAYLAPQTSDLVQAHLVKAKILLATDRLAEAQTELEAALEIEPKLGQVYLALSQIHLAQENLAEAARYAEAALFLEETPATLAQAAATARSDTSTAIQDYDEAFVRLTANTDPNLSRYATEVARRRPLPVNFLPCLLWIYPTPRLVDITLAEGVLLESQADYHRAAQVYHRLLRFEPTLSVVQEKLAALCQEHLEACDHQGD